MASRSANVAGNDDRCGGCSIFARVCGSVGWGWEDERALDSPYYVLEGTELRQCPSLEKAREAADAYRKSGAEGLERVRRAGVASWIREAVTAASVASVCVKIGEDQLVPIDELIGILAEDRRLLATLTPREEQVIRMRFGIERATCDTLEEIAKQLDVTRERVREIEAKALRKLGMGGRGGKIKALREQKFC
jgi:DNA-binding CsgD family transcriptional regulator